MAILAASFLADLDDLSVNAEYEGELLGDRMEEDRIDSYIENLNYDDYDLDSVSKLEKSQWYIDIMQKVDDALLINKDQLGRQEEVLEDDHGLTEYQLIVDCNAVSVDIQDEIVIIHNFIRDNYRMKFPELESLVHHPIDYARVVKKIGNEVDLTMVDLEGLLPSAMIMVVSITASTTNGNPLPEECLHKTIHACDRVLTLDLAKKKVLQFLESRMGYIAPNLSAIVGSAVAAKLMVTAGGLSSLANMPACNVHLLGEKRMNLAGFSTAATSRVGYVEQTELIQSTPPMLRERACRLLASKSILAARVDYVRGDPTGKPGRRYREEIRKKIEKWQEPPPAKQSKPLPVPDIKPIKKKRGGRRLRKTKERYGITEMMKLANKIRFGVPEESSLGDGFGVGYGMLGQAGNGKLRVPSIGQSKLAAKVAKKFKVRSYGSS